jgi:hypothetical protein
LKISTQKNRAGGMAQDVGPEFKSQYRGKKKLAKKHIKSSLKDSRVQQGWEPLP